MSILLLNSLVLSFSHMLFVIYFRIRHRIVDPACVRIGSVTAGHCMPVEHAHQRRSADQQRAGMTRQSDYTNTPKVCIIICYYAAPPLKGHITHRIPSVRLSPRLYGHVCRTPASNFGSKSFRKPNLFNNTSQPRLITLTAR